MRATDPVDGRAEERGEGRKAVVVVVGRRWKPYPGTGSLEGDGWLGSAMARLRTLAHPRPALARLSSRAQSPPIACASPRQPSTIPPPSPSSPTRCLPLASISAAASQRSHLIPAAPWRASQLCPPPPWLPPPPPPSPPPPRAPLPPRRRCWRSAAASSMATKWCSAPGEQVCSPLSTFRLILGLEFAESRNFRMLMCVKIMVAMLHCVIGPISGTNFVCVKSDFLLGFACLL